MVSGKTLRLLPVGLLPLLLRLLSCSLGLPLLLFTFGLRLFPFCCALLLLAKMQAVQCCSCSVNAIGVGLQHMQQDW